MQDPSVPLAIAVTSFLAVLLWRVRPLVDWTSQQRASREALREAKARVDSAKDEAERARALCDAADLVATHVHTRGGALGLYLRAVRANPTSVEIVDRAVRGLAKRPRSLESLLWRQLSLVPQGRAPDVTRASLGALRSLYEGPLRSGVRARALQNVLDALK